MTKIDLITGILGAGKTTFLLRYADYLIRQGHRIAVLENDFGAVNADMAYLRELPADRCTVASLTGCCDPTTHRRRLKTQLISMKMQGIERVILEPSGIFDMDAFFDTLCEPPLDAWYEIGAVLTVADAQGQELLSAQMEYLLASEAACCGRIIVSKLEQIPPAARASAVERVQAHIARALTGIQCDRVFSPGDFLAKPFGELDDSDFAALSEAGCRISPYVKQYQAEMIDSEVHYFLHIAIPEAQIGDTVRGILADPECGKIYRIKGTLPNGSAWLRLNAAGDSIRLSPAPSGQAVLIVIGDTLNRDALDRHFRAVNTDPQYLCV